MLLQLAATAALVGILCLALVVLSSARPAHADLSGNYTGSADLGGGFLIPITASLEQHGTTVTGTLSVTGFACLSGLTFLGTLSGDTVTGEFSGASTLLIAATVSGTSVIGSYTVTQSPCAAGTGTFSLSRVVPTPTGQASAPPTPTRVRTATPTRTRTPTLPADATATPTATVEHTRAPSNGCAGDCNGDAQVTVDEVLSMVNVALGNASVSSCWPGDDDGDEQISVNEIILGVNYALDGCPAADAPRVSSVLPASTSRIVPLSLVHVRGTQFPPPQQLPRATVGDVEAEIVAVIDANTLAVIIPAIAPGNAQVVIFNGETRGVPYPINVLPPTAIAPPDSVDATLALLDQSTADLLALDLEAAFADDAPALREALADFRDTVAEQRTLYTSDSTLTAAQRAQLDAAIDASGLPDLLRDLIEELQDVAAPSTARDRGAAAGDTVAVLGAARGWGQTLAVARGILGSLGGPTLATVLRVGVAALATGAVATAAGFVAGAVIGSATAHAPMMMPMLIPLILQAEFLDANGIKSNWPSEGGRIRVRAINFDQDTVRLRIQPEISAVPFDIEPLQVSGDRITFELPYDHDLCGYVTFGLFDFVTQRFAQPVAQRVLPELLGREPMEGKPSDIVTMTALGVGNCVRQAYARFQPAAGGHAPFQPLRTARTFLEFETEVPNLAPDTYELSITIGNLDSSRGNRVARPFKILSAVTGLRVSCQRTEVFLPPAAPNTSICTAIPLPEGVSFPPVPATNPGLLSTAWRSSDTDVAEVMPATSNGPNATTNVVPHLDGRAGVTAHMNLGGIVLDSQPVSIKITDVSAPTVELTTSSPMTVNPGADIVVHVVARDNAAVTRVRLSPSANVTLVGATELPCAALTRVCMADFTVRVPSSNITDRNVTLQASAFDTSGLRGNSTTLPFVISEDTHCPQLTIQSPPAGSTVNAGETITVTALATDNRPGDTGIVKFRYSASGAALASNVGPQDLPQPMLAQSTLRFTFKVKSAAELGSVTDRNITIRVQAFDNAMPPLTCEAQAIIVTAAGSGPRTCRSDKDCGGDRCDKNTRTCCGRAADCSDGTMCNESSQCSNGVCGEVLLSEALTRTCCGAGNCLSGPCTSHSQCYAAGGNRCDAITRRCCGSGEFAHRCSDGTPCDPDNGISGGCKGECDRATRTCKNTPLGSPDGARCPFLDECTGGTCNETHDSTATCCGQTPNCIDGTACTRDSQCRNGICNEFCCGANNCGEGDRCIQDSNCASGHCDTTTRVCCSRFDFHCHDGTTCTEDATCLGSCNPRTRTCCGLTIPCD